MQQPELHEIRIREERQLEEEYSRMAAHAEHEREAEEWCEALIGDATE